jgi:hypothetical protein
MVAAGATGAKGASGSGATGAAAGATGASAAVATGATGATDPPTSPLNSGNLLSNKLQFLQSTSQGGSSVGQNSQTQGLANTLGAQLTSDLTSLGNANLLNQGNSPGLVGSLTTNEVKGTGFALGQDTTGNPQVQNLMLPKT